MILLPPNLKHANPLLTDYLLGTKQEYRAITAPLRILLLNLMPEKATTEEEMVRMLEGSGYDIELILTKLSGQSYKTTPQSYMEEFYTDFEHLSHEKYEGMIVTGAPIEHLDFEVVRYWEKLQQVMDWAKQHVRSTLYLCWGAQAALYHHWNIAKHPLKEKMFGVFPYQILQDNSLFQGLSPEFRMPTSRHTEVLLSDCLSTQGLDILAHSDTAGVGVALSSEHKAIYITGHLEYALPRLHNEYQRDLSKGKKIHAPLYYYKDGQPLFSWKEDALTIYHNWVKYHVAAQ